MLVKLFFFIHLYFALFYFLLVLIVACFSSSDFPVETDLSLYFTDWELSSISGSVGVFRHFLFTGYYRADILEPA